MQYDTGFGEV